MFPLGSRCWACVGVIGLLLGPLARPAQAVAPPSTCLSDAPTAGISQVQIDVVVARVRQGPGQVFGGVFESRQTQDYLSLLVGLERKGLAKILALPRQPFHVQHAGSLLVRVPRRVQSPVASLLLPRRP